nr:MAG TPA: hypothetical protein [Caudoviricetes sp.]
MSVIWRADESRIYHDNRKRCWHNRKGSRQEQKDT